MLGVSRTTVTAITLLGVSLLLVSCHTVRTFPDLPPNTAAKAEECLVDFSKKIKGHMLADGPLPADLDTGKFFSLLDADYPDKTCFRTARAYPIAVRVQEESYVLFLCDQTKRWVVYEDWGKTMDRVDHPYVRERKEVRCPIQ